MRTEPRGARPAQGWVIRVVPLALLIVLALLGLRGTIATPRWNGPWRGSGTAVGVALVAVLLSLLVMTWLRHRAAAPSDWPGPSAAATSGHEANLDVPAKLRLVLMAVLSSGIVATVVTVLIALHLHLFSVKPHQLRPLPTWARRPGRSGRPGSSAVIRTAGSWSGAGSATWAFTTPSCARF